MRNRKGLGDAKMMQIRGSTQIIAGSVVENNVATGAITEAKIGANAVTSAKIAVSAVGSDQIAANAVVQAKIAYNAVGNAQIAYNAVDSNQINANAVTQAKVAYNAIGSNQIAYNAVDSNQIASNAVIQAKIAYNAVGTNQVADLAISTVKIANNAIDGTKIAYNAVDSNQINANAVVQAKIAYNAVGSNQIAYNAVDVTKIEDGAVTPVKMLLNDNLVFQGTHAYSITNIRSPLTDYEAANKVYVDNIATQNIRWKDPVRYLGTATDGPAHDGNYPVTTGYAIGETIDGAALVDGDHVALDHQTNTRQNGCWIAHPAPTPWERAPGWAIGTDVSGAAFLVEEGSTYTNTQWTVNPIPITAYPIIIGPNDGSSGSYMDLVKIAGVDLYTAGDGIDIVSNVISAPVDKEKGLSYSVLIPSGPNAITLLIQDGEAPETTNYQDFTTDHNFCTDGTAGTIALLQVFVNGVCQSRGNGDYTITANNVFRLDAAVTADDDVTVTYLQVASNA